MNSILEKQQERAALIASCVQASLLRTESEADALRGRTVDEQIEYVRLQAILRLRQEENEAELKAKKQKKIDDAIATFEAAVGRKPVISQSYGNRLLITCDRAFVKAKRKSVIPAALAKLSGIVMGKS